ncbi:unnamed protein product [Candidula unifasciata]|uniref:RRP12-like protein n=1 Tax=Candidula unifasciata TaxID=100452 RepID=A0A8S3YV60_9EUPU|nr:unnamed protein product [Candidula unifasciata]
MKVATKQDKPFNRKFGNAKPKAKMKLSKKKLPKSSSSNPTVKKFREAAKRSAVGGHFPNIGSTKATLNQQLGNGLTLEALEKHNAAIGEFTEASLQDDAASIGGTTFNTWATNLTGCTNVTFNRVHRYINSSSSVQKEILAVLAAVTEVIKEKGGEGKDVQYFGVLVSSLQEADKTDTKMAMAHLLSIVIKKVPLAVLQSRFSQVVKVLLDVITDCVKQETFSPLKAALSCLASLLRVQDVNRWTEPSTEHAYRALLAFVSHRKPKLRKAAHTAVKIVLRGSLLMQQTPAPPFHPAAPLTAQHCLKLIESSKGPSSKVEILHILSLLKDILSLCPHSNVKSLCESLLKIMTLTDLVVRSTCMEVLHRLFTAKPTSKIMPADMNGQIITALYDYQPSEKDGQPMIAWLKVMEAAAVNLASQDAELGINHLPRLFSTCMTCLLSDRHDVAKAAVATMKALLLECLEPNKEVILAKKANSQTVTALQKVMKSLETGLSYQFHSMWGLVFQLWSTVFLAVGKIIPEMLLKCLSSMGDLRDTPHFSYKVEMDHAIGSAVKAMGPRLVLKAIPLGITGDHDNLEFPRAWLLPVIRDNITHTELGFFTSYFLPLAARFKNIAEVSARNNQIAKSKAYETLQLQIWSMLKGFCDHPTDLKQSFQGIAKTLGTALSDREDLRMDVMSALRSLIMCSLDSDSDKAEIGRFAKNFLPILFNLFTTPGLNDGMHLAVLETVKKYLLVSDSKLLSAFLDKCLEKMGDLEVNIYRNIALLDLAIAMIPYADPTRLNQMFELALPRVQSDDKTIQKKSYRVLEEICSGKTAGCRDLLSSNLDKITETLLHSLSKSSPSSKAPRLRCLIHVYKNLQEKNMYIFMATLPEAILCTKEIGVKARAAAYELIIVMSETYIRWHGDVTEKESLGEFVNKVLAGLAGSPHMISATLLALTRIVYHYKDKLAGAVLDNMIDSVCLLLASKTREIIKTALGFVKVILSAYENTVLAAHLKDLLNSLHEIAVKGNMRRLTKIIYLKLIKRFGYELIVNLTQEGVHKLLKNIHKSQERAKRKEKEDAGSEDEDEESDDEDQITAQPESIDDLLKDTDSEMDDDDSKKTRVKKGKKRHGKDAWLMETGDDGIVDFMDPTASKQVFATKPKDNSGDKKTEDKERGFKLSADGRLIITQDEEEKEKGRKRSGNEDDNEDELEELLAAMGGELRNKTKKRKMDAAAPGDSDDGNEPSTSKYKAGGSGIHRPTAQESRQPKEKSAAFGQDYRAKRASGDMKKKGQPDPFAYVPLDFKSLNKRKQMKVKGSFKNLVKGAKKGAASGMKFKARRGKKQ